MPLPVISNAYRCAMIQQGPSGALATTVFHFGAGGTTATDVADSIDNALLAGNPWSFVSSLFTSGIIEVTALDGVSASVQKPTARLAGTQSGQTLFEAAAVIKFLTALRGREHRGRIFIGPLTESSVDEGVIDSGTVSGLQSAIEDFTADLEATLGGSMKVASYKLGSVENVISFLVTPQQRTQRRRLKRVT